MKKITPVILFISIVLLFNRCQFIGVSGDGKVISQDRGVSSFSELSVSGPFEIHLVQSNEPKVRVEADENLQDYIHVTMDGDELKIKTTESFHSPYTARLYISVGELEKLSCAGDIHLDCDSVIKLKNLDASFAGSYDAHLNLYAIYLKSNLAGAGTLHVTGNVNETEYSAAGSSSIKAFDCQSSTCTISIAGSGHAEVNASDNLKVTIAGAGSVKYRGDPKVQQKIMGAGSVEKE